MRRARTYAFVLASIVAATFVAHGFQVRAARHTDDPPASPQPASPTDNDGAAEAPAGSETRRAPARLPQAPLAPGRSYSLSVLRPRPLDIDIMTPSVLTPFADDTLVNGVPDT